MSKPSFVIPTPRKPVDPSKLEEFAAGAGKPIELAVAAPIVEHPKSKITYADRNKGMLLKLLPEQFDRFEQVFAASAYKSKQKMGEELLMKGLEELAKQLNI